MHFENWEKDGEKKSMKKRWLLFTTASAAGLLAAGIFLLPIAYSAVFRAEDIVEEEEALPESLGAAPGDFMEAFRYPLEEEREALTREDGKSYVEYCKEELGSRVYQEAFRLVGLEEEERFWENLWIIREEGCYLMEAPVEREGVECTLSMAMNGDRLPFLVWRKAGRRPSGAETEEAAEALGELSRGQDGRLRAYVEEIDRIYEDCPDYWLQVNRLYVSLLARTELTEEMPARIPLWECCVRGTWQVCGDEEETALVCAMGKGSLVLYYDGAEGDFCGYRFWPPEGWR